VVGREALLPRLLGQAERVARRLRETGKKARTVTLKVKYSDFELATRRCTIPFATDDGKVLFEVASAQLGRADLTRPIRLTGVSASGFDPAPAEQLGLFDRRAGSPDGSSFEGAPRVPSRRREALNTAVDELNDRFGPGAVRKATLSPGRNRK
jgi:DNA polymerase IV